MEYIDEKVLAMYDVRGIQNYIFRTAKVKDAIGASKIVDGIIEKALSDAVNKAEFNNKINGKDVELNWKQKSDNDENEVVLPYDNSDKKIQVLYIGGGNGLVIFEDDDLYLDITKHMSKYVIENTYSLQLAAAKVRVSDNYQKDNYNLRIEMDRVKAEMIVSKPIGALPVMEVEVKTGYPVTADYDDKSKNVKISKESFLKLQTEQGKRQDMDASLKRFDNYVTKKGIDSTIAVVHIDGNNMGLRIRELMEGREDYIEAINVMRAISFNIDHSYKSVFEEMKNFFNENAGKKEEISEKENDFFVLEVLVAGDDITYICNGKIALDTVDYFCNMIKNVENYSMVTGIDKDLLKKNKEEDSDVDISKYGFDLCAGIAFVNSHFPFYAGYDVAEACASNAKKYAKAQKKKADDRVGNWVDFHICRNIQAKDLNKMREKEYTTSRGEQLLLRPYFIDTQEDKQVELNVDSKSQAGGQVDSVDVYKSFASFKKNLQYFQDEVNIPRTFAKELRNIYPQGRDQAKRFMAFLSSRNWKMPDGRRELYITMHDEKKDQDIFIAKWYDALEMMDYYVSLNFEKEENEEEE